MCLVGDRSRRRDVLVAAVDVNSLLLVVDVSRSTWSLFRLRNTSLCPIGEAREGLPIASRAWDLVLLFRES